MQAPQTPWATIQRRTADEISAAGRMISRYHNHLDLRSLILSRTQHPGKPIDTRHTEAWAEVSESCRQRSGQAAMGTWVPLGVLSRGLDIASASDLVIEKKDPQAAAGLLPYSAVVGGGATIITGLQGSSYSIATVDPSLDASDGWLDEGEVAVTREPEFKNATLSPHVISIQVSVSRQLLHNAAVDVNALLARELTTRLSYAIDAAAINGTGTSQPLGLLRNEALDVASAGANGAAPIYAHLVELEHRVLTRSGGNTLAPTYLMSPTLAKKLRTTQRVSGGDRFIFEGGDLLGHAVRIAPHMPDNLDKGDSLGNCSALLFGDLSELVVGFWGPAAIDLLVDDITQRKDGKVRIVARAEVGIAPRRIGAFAAYLDLLAS